MRAFAKPHIRCARPGAAPVRKKVTVKNEFELVLDEMISSWFRWYWLALASLLLIGAAL